MSLSTYLLNILTILCCPNPCAAPHHKSHRNSNYSNHSKNNFHQYFQYSSSSTRFSLLSPSYKKYICRQSFKNAFLFVKSTFSTCSATFVIGPETNSALDLPFSSLIFSQMKALHSRLLCKEDPALFLLPLIYES